MTRVVIIGSSLEALQQAHRTLDKRSSVEMTIYTEDAEIGFPNVDIFEEIDLGKFLNSMPDEWIGSIPAIVERKGASAVALSWLCKAMAIRLAKRGVRFQLRTSILDIDEDRQKISFRGGGRVPLGTDRYDELHDYR